MDGFNLPKFLDSSEFKRLANDKQSISNNSTPYTSIEISDAFSNISVSNNEKTSFLDKLSNLDKVSDSDSESKNKSIGKHINNYKNILNQKSDFNMDGGSGLMDFLKDTFSIDNKSDNSEQKEDPSKDSSETDSSQTDIFEQLLGDKPVPANVTDDNVLDGDDGYKSDNEQEQPTEEEEEEDKPEEEIDRDKPAEEEEEDKPAEEEEEDKPEEVDRDKPEEEEEERDKPEEEEEEEEDKPEEEEKEDRDKPEEEDEDKPEEKEKEDRDKPEEEETTTDYETNKLLNSIKVETDGLRDELQKLKLKSEKLEDDAEIMKTESRDLKNASKNYIMEKIKDNGTKYLFFNEEMFFDKKTEFTGNMLYGLDSNNEFKIGCIKKGENINNNVYMKFKFINGDKTIDYLLDHINIIDDGNKCNITPEGIHIVKDNSPIISISDKGLSYKGKQFIEFKGDDVLFNFENKINDTIRKREDATYNKLKNITREYSDNNKQHISKILDKMEGQSKILLEKKCAENKERCMEFLKEQVLPTKNNDLKEQLINLCNQNKKECVELIGEQIKLIEQKIDESLLERLSVLEAKIGEQPIISPAIEKPNIVSEPQQLEMDEENILEDMIKGMNIPEPGISHSQEPEVVINNMPDTFDNFKGVVGEINPNTPVETAVFTPEDISPKENLIDSILNSDKKIFNLDDDMISHDDGEERDEFPEVKSLQFSELFKPDNNRSQLEKDLSNIFNQGQGRNTPQLLEIHIPEDEPDRGPMEVHTPDNKELFSVIKQILNKPELFNRREEVGLTKPGFDFNMDKETFFTNVLGNRNQHNQNYSPISSHGLESLNGLSEHSIMGNSKPTAQGETFRRLNYDIDGQKDLVSNILSHEPDKTGLGENVSKGVNPQDILDGINSYKKNDRSGFKQYIFNLNKMLNG